MAGDLAAAAAAGFGQAGAGLAIVSLPPAHTPAVLEPLASALAELPAAASPGRAGARRKVRPVELVIEDAAVITMGPDGGTARAMLVRDGRIAAVGDSGEIRAAAARARRWPGWTGPPSSPV